MSLDVVLVVVGALLFVLDLLSEILRRLYLSVPLLALAVGVLLGPEVLGVIDAGPPAQARELLEQLARVTLALMLVAIGLKFRRPELSLAGGPAARLLSAGMFGMWALVSLGAWLLLDLPLWAAALLGAILTPTDPVVASTLVSEQLALANLPRRLRFTLQLEAGANDGLAVALVLLPLLIITDPTAPVGHWVGTASAELGVAIGVGAAIGYAGGHATNLAARNKIAQRALLVGASAGVAAAVLGGVHLLGGSGILAAFIAGLTMSLVLDDDVHEILEELQEALGNLFVPPTFALFGAVLPWSGWAALGLGGLLFAAWALFLRRPPVVAGALAGSDLRARDRAFLAWFGPLGVAAMYYAAFATEKLAPEAGDRIFAAATLAVLASVLLHSVSATPGVRLLAGRSPTAPLRHPLTPGVEDAP